MGRIVVPFAIKLLETNVPNVEDKLAKRVSKLIELLLRYDEAIRDAAAIQNGTRGRISNRSGRL